MLCQKRSATKRSGWWSRRCDGKRNKKARLRSSLARIAVAFLAFFSSLGQVELRKCLHLAEMGSSPFEAQGKSARPLQRQRWLIIGGRNQPLRCVIGNEDQQGSKPNRYIEAIKGEQAVGKDKQEGADGRQSRG